MDAFCGSPFWDADLIWNTLYPEFTSCFISTILVWSPCVLLFALAPFDLYSSFTSKYSDIPWGPLNIFRLSVVFGLSILSFCDFIVAATSKSQNLHTVHLVTPAVKLLSFILAGCLTCYHRKQGIVSSGYLFSFWFTITLLATPQYFEQISAFYRRTMAEIPTEQENWDDYEYTSFMIFFSLLLLQLGAQCIADKRPQHSSYPLPPKSEKPSPEPYAAFVQSIFFTWFDPLAWTGYRRSLEDRDIWDINPSNSSAELVPLFDKYWKENVETKGMSKNMPEFRKSTQGHIVPVLFYTFSGPFICGGVMKLAVDLCTFANPQVLSLLIDFTSNAEAPVWHGILFAVIFFAVATLSALFNGQFSYKCYLAGFRIRTVLISAIYRKALRLSNAAKRNNSVGEIVNLMSVDAERFFELMIQLHIIWSGPLVIAICVYFLWGILGVASLTGIVVMVVMIPMNAYVANQLKNYQAKQMSKKDERVKMMNEIIGGMKVLKLYAWESSFEGAIKKIRSKELQVIKQSSVVSAYVFFIWNMIPFLVTIISFTTFVFVDPENNKITANTVFVSLSLFNILRMPMTLFPIMLQMVMQAWVSVTRINTFLNAEEIDDKDVTKNKDRDYTLRIDRATFTWGGDHVPVLEKLCMRIEKGELAALVGPVGCGKSSLVSSILGETDKTKGTVNIDGTIAYVSQQAWIQNATLRDNILFGRKYDKKFYDAVVGACALTQDLKILPGGDQTEIGEKGINLSGGQKQRVALARAVYSRADFYLLDDPLSAVDSQVGKHIFDNVLGPNGILSNTTRLLVTHGISYLPHCDTILVMNGGKITEKGQYDTLIAQKGAFAEFIIQHMQTMQDKTMQEDELADEIIETPTEENMVEILFKRVSEMSINRQGKSALSKSKSSLTVGEGITLIGKEAAAVGSVPIGVYIRYIRSAGWWYSALCIITIILYQSLQVFSSTLLSDWSALPDANEPQVRDYYLIVYTALGIAQAISLFTSTLVLALGCLRAAGVLHENLLLRVMRLPMTFFDSTPLGRIMNRFSGDVDVVDNLLPASIKLWILMFFNVLAILIVICITTPSFMAVIVPLALIYYFIQTFYVATSRQLKRIESITRSPIYTHFSESINGQSTIRAFGATARFINDSEKRVDFNQQCMYPRIIAGRWLAIRLESIGGLVIFFAALFAVLGRETLPSAMVGLSITYALQITAILSSLVRNTAEVETNIVAIERMEEYTEEKTEAAWVTRKMNPGWPTEGKVVFDNYKLRYREGLNYVLNGISVTIDGGEKVGIVGRTGAGKSSLALALFRIIESSGGLITIDGIDISQIGLHSLRSRLTIIPQDPVLFAGTLRMNIDPFDDFSDEQIWDALEHSHLKAFVKGTSSGLLHEISEGGENLSIGQRQLMCLARALLRKTKLLILDEATAAVDLETDDLIQKTIRQQFNDCTVLTIAHRLNTILDSDKVLVLDAGSVAEYASPQSLLDDNTSIFYSMAKDARLVGGINNGNS